MGPVMPGLQTMIHEHIKPDLRGFRKNHIDNLSFQKCLYRSLLLEHLKALNPLKSIYLQGLGQKPENQ